MAQYFNPSEGIILNSGTLSRCPKTVIQAVHKYTDDYELNPTVSLFGTWERMWSIQKTVAAFFGANANDFFLRPNVTVAMNDFLLGMELPAGAIVVSDLEYGAIVNICKLRARRDNRELATIQLKTGADSYKTEDEVIADILRQLPKQTAALMLSHVMTGSGLTLPIEKLGKALRSHGVLFAVDGAHGPGAADLDFTQLQNVDYYGGNLHKWFMGPKGTAFGWAHPVIQKRMQPIMGTWTTEPANEHFRGFGDGHEFALKMLMSHTNNFTPYFALVDTVKFWNQVGKENIFRTLLELRNYTEDTMTELFGWPLLTPKNPALRGPLLSYSLPAKVRARGFQMVRDMWEKQKVQIMTPMVHGELALRLSPHIYNTTDEIHRGLTTFKKYCDGI